MTDTRTEFEKSKPSHGGGISPDYTRIIHDFPDLQGSKTFTAAKSRGREALYKIDAAFRNGRQSVLKLKDNTGAVVAQRTGPGIFFLDLKGEYVIEVLGQPLSVQIVEQ